MIISVRDKNEIKLLGETLLKAKSEEAARGVRNCLLGDVTYDGVGYGTCSTRAVVTGAFGGSFAKHLALSGWRGKSYVTKRCLAVTYGGSCSGPYGSVLAFGNLTTGEYVFRVVGVDAGIDDDGTFYTLDGGRVIPDSSYVNLNVNSGLLGLFHSTDGGYLVSLLGREVYSGSLPYCKKIYRALHQELYGSAALPVNSSRNGVSYGDTRVTGTKVAVGMFSSANSEKGLAYSWCGTASSVEGYAIESSRSQIIFYHKNREVRRVDLKS